MADWTPFLIAILAFSAMSGIVFVVGQLYLQESRLRERLPIVAPREQADVDRGSNLARFVARHFDEKRFGVDDTWRGKLRLNLVRAGYFRHDAINLYLLWRVVTLLLLPLITYVLFEVLFPRSPLTTQFVIIAVATGIGVVGPDAFISRRQRSLSAEYRILFPDFLDLLVVCTDAGLTLEGAVRRVTSEIGGRRNRIFGINLALMAAEMRAGRSFIEAVGALA